MQKAAADNQRGPLHVAITIHMPSPMNTYKPAVVLMLWLDPWYRFSALKQLQRSSMNQCVQESEADAREGVVADANAQGMLTPPQPAPKENAAEAEPEAEMSFTDLIDDSDEEAQGHGTGQEAHSLEKALVAEEQILVDPEDLEVSAFLHPSSIAGHLGGAIQHVGCDCTNDSFACRFFPLLLWLDALLYSRHTIK